MPLGIGVMLAVLHSAGKLPQKILANLGTKITDILFKNDLKAKNYKIIFII